eukprot:CAMPEP_0167813520 /NCGR_PEP_ID=MMETSP0112_2-20121227/1902_1 /TAXON_ID=91324 /ORGANISM="Lotharella globosa, Strain CCCM811" /LENGTH=213 /DNA_ID=CAMNT_0007712617 /DNA_START=293 /DNA_END=937 /DNA_ORIENTATION=+
MSVGGADEEIEKKYNIKRRRRADLSRYMEDSDSSSEHEGQDATSIVSVKHANTENMKRVVNKMVSNGKKIKEWSTSSSIPEDVRKASQFVDEMLSHAFDMKVEHKKMRVFKGPKGVFKSHTGVNRVCDRIKATKEPKAGNLLLQVLPVKARKKVLRMSLSKEERTRLDSKRKAKAKAKLGKVKSLSANTSESSKRTGESGKKSTTKRLLKSRR